MITLQNELAQAIDTKVEKIQSLVYRKFNVLLLMEVFL